MLRVDADWFPRGTVESFALVSNAQDMARPLSHLLVENLLRENIDGQAHEKKRQR